MHNERAFLFVAIMLVTLAVVFASCAPAGKETPTPSLAATSAPTISPSPTPTLQPEPTIDPQAAQVDELFAIWDRSDSPGCMVNIIQAGTSVHQRGYGMANLEHGIPISTFTVFNAGSIAKQFTAASILLLAEEGSLSLDDKVQVYIPDLAGYEEVTIRHLLNHTSGIPDYYGRQYDYDTLALLLKDLGLRSQYTSQYQVIKILATEGGPQFESGEQWEYSNTNYVFLAKIVEQVSGQPFPKYVDENLFEPLGMEHSYISDDHAAVIPNRATGYKIGGQSSYRSSGHLIDLVGDGNLFTTAGDLATWHQSLYEQKIGGPGFLEQMQTKGKLNNGKEIPYASGLIYLKLGRWDAIGHGGVYYGFASEMFRFSEHDFSVIVLCNQDGVNTERLVSQIGDIYLAGE